MVSLETVRQNNSGLKGFGPNLVAVFVGGTSGIGEATARAFIRETESSRVYLVGRNETQASKIIEELRQINPDGQISFVKCEAARLHSVDEACKSIQEKEEKVNLLFMTAGMMTTKGRDETDEGLDKKFSLHYYSRARFAMNLLPQLSKAATANESGRQGLGSNLSRVVSVLSPGDEISLHLDDLDLKTHYSLRNCAGHAITMNSLLMQELAAAHPETSFIHAYPGGVKTGIMREFHPITQLAISALAIFAKPWMVPLDESGERHLYASTSPQYSPQASGDGDVAIGADGKTGSGAYLLSWDGSITGNKKVLEAARQNETGKLVWKHTMEIFTSICGK
ncbi:hypothetical protein N7451_000736 [Penicillium sp. IBT 35674x]|nr:hypothetical protein N7451_000736 [Penicillium sp. IBT 35674x]